MYLLCYLYGIISVYWLLIIIFEMKNIVCIKELFEFKEKVLQFVNYFYILRIILLGVLYNLYVEFENDFSELYSFMGCLRFGEVVFFDIVDIRFFLWKQEVVFFYFQIYGVCLVIVIISDYFFDFRLFLLVQLGIKENSYYKYFFRLLVWKSSKQNSECCLVYQNKLLGLLSFQ